MNSICWPDEIVKRPRPLVVLTGLNVEENPVHKSIWDGFSKIRSQERASLNIKLFPTTHEYPKCKNKRVSYEWYVPKGILKSCWMQKHMEEIPSLIVVFYDLDWDDIQWRDRVNDCSSLVNIIKMNVQGRLTKIIVVLVQKRVIMPGEDAHNEQKAQLLCQVCDLSGNRNLFVLPATESLFGYITRLEKEFQDLANNYYQSLIKKVKSHRESLNKTTHLLLFIRHHFKIAFYQEFRQEHALALKNYKQSYNYLRELRFLDTHLLEIKSVAGFINYKICCLSFQNNVSDAINQFRNHIDIFKGVCGISELVFEHEAWISKQFEVMGDLFRDAIRQGLTAITTQNPGLYYEEAALHAIARKSFSHPKMVTSARSLNLHYRISEVSYIHIDEKSSLSVNDAMALVGGQVYKNTEFYGQRPWRQGKQSIEIGDPVKERESITAMRILEKSVDHSEIIIPLLRNTMEYYQKYKANRMKLLSCVLMGEEYISAGNFSQALKCFSKVITEYRLEKWYSLLLPALLNCLKCTYMTGSASEYLAFCLELISNECYQNEDEKSRIGRNFCKVLQNGIPDAEPGISKGNVEKVNKLWKKLIDEYEYDESKEENFTVSMDGIESSLSCKIVFGFMKAFVNEKVEFSVFLRCNTNLTIDVEDLEVIFSDQRYNMRYHLIDSKEFPLSISNNDMREIKFYVIPISDETCHMIKVDKIRVKVGKSTHHGHVILQWTASKDEYLRQAFYPPEPIEFRSQNNSVPWSSVLAVPFVELMPRNSQFQLSLTHSDPVLLHENHEVTVTFVNNENQRIESILITVFIEEETSSLSKSRFVEIQSEDQQSLNLVSYSTKKIEYELLSIEQGTSASETVYITATNIGKIRIGVDICYKIQIDIEQYTNLCQCVKSEATSTTVIDPFQVMTKLLSPFMIPVQEIVVAEPFLFQITIANVSNIAIEIEKTEILLNDQVALVENSDDSEGRLNREVVHSFESACEVLMMKVGRNISQEYSYVAIGKYLIHWRRSQSKLLPVGTEATSRFNQSVVSTVTLPDWSLDTTPLTVDIDMDSHGTCQVPLTITYSLRNKTLYPIEVETQLDLSEQFMLAGVMQQQQLRVLPGSLHQLRYRLLPLVPGFLSLPHLHVKMRSSSFSSVLQNNSVTGTVMSNQQHQGSFTDDRQFEDKFLSRLPSFIFVKPIGKSTTTT